MYRNKEQFHLYKFLNLKYFNKQCYISTENVEEIFPKFEFTSIIQTMVKNNDLICIDLYKVLVLLFYYKIQDNCISIGK